MTIDVSDLASSQSETLNATEELRQKDSGTRFRFCCYMVISYVSMQGTIFLGHDQLGLNENIATAIAIVLVSLMNFFWLMHFVYRTADGSRWRQFVLYVQSIVGFRLWELVVFYVLHDLLGMYYLLASTIMQAQSIMMKFIIYKQMIFRSDHHPDKENLAIHDAPPDLSADESS